MTCLIVIPLFKQGKSFDLNNYRPISVISVVAKVFERIVYDQLYNFLRTVPTIVIAHTFCASRDTRISYR